MWTINDFPAYEMVSGWSTHKKLACPYCMENNNAFTLTNRGKVSFLTVTVVSCHRITGTERISLLVELKRLKTNIVETICKLEMIFPPSCFDLIEHLCTFTV